MTVAPQRLIEDGRLDFDGLRQLRTMKGQLDSYISSMEAFAYAIRGEIEAVVSSKTGCIRFFRMKTAAVKIDICLPETFSGGSSFIARTNLGTYREPLASVVVMDKLGHRFVAGEGGFVGHCFTHCGQGDRRPVRI